MKRSLVALVALGCAFATARSSADDEKDPKAVRQAALEKNGGSEATEAAVTSGLRWLARHQSKDGHWGPTSFTEKCTGKECAGQGLDDFKVGVTSLALLGFLQAGYLPGAKETYTDPVTEKEVDLGRVVKKGLDWLVSQQRDDGSIGPKVSEQMYNQAFATRVLCEALLRTKDEDSWKEPAEKAVSFLHTAQNFNLGWRYTSKCGNNDTSVTGACVLALRAAKLAGLKVKKATSTGALAWVKRVTDSNGVTGYDRLGSGEIFAPGKNETWAHHPTMTAVGMLIHTYCEGKEDDDAHTKGAKILVGDLPKWDPAADRPTVDFYYWYYGTLALFESAGPASKKWAKWNEAVTTALVENQKGAGTGCREGSWASDKVERWAYAGGRVYATAINVLTLEVYYAHERVFGE